MPTFCKKKYLGAFPSLVSLYFQGQTRTADIEKTLVMVLMDHEKYTYSIAEIYNYAKVKFNTTRRFWAILATFVSSILVSPWTFWPSFDYLILGDA